MPGFESIIDQDRPLRILNSFLQKGTIPHALLFTGPEGVGKENAAVAFAMACNCSASKSSSETGRANIRTDDFPDSGKHQKRERACGSCKSCRKIKSNNHPDIIRVQPFGSFIKIDQIRALCQTLALKPYEAIRRVVIMTDAHSMNPAAGNALLKALEEPPANTILILVTARASGLLPTIISRCQPIRFNPISRQNLVSALMHEYGVGSDEAGIIAAMAGGSMSRALRMHRNNWIKRRNWLIGELDALSTGSVNRFLAVANQLSNSKDDLPDAFEVIKSWFRDLLIAKLHPHKVLNHDLAATLQQTSQKISLTSLLSKFETIQSAQNAIQAGTHIRLAMETMLLKLSRI